jgi:hypothetical protein
MTNNCIIKIFIKMEKSSSKAVGFIEMFDKLLQTLLPYKGPGWRSG